MAIWVCSGVCHCDTIRMGLSVRLWSGNRAESGDIVASKLGVLPAMPGTSVSTLAAAACWAGRGS